VNSMTRGFFAFLIFAPFEWYPYAYASILGQSITVWKGENLACAILMQATAGIAIFSVAVAIVVGFANAAALIHHRVRSIAPAALLGAASALGIVPRRAFRAHKASTVAVAIVVGFANAAALIHHRVRSIATAALLGAASALGIVPRRAFRAHMAIIAAGAILVLRTWWSKNTIALVLWSKNTIDQFTDGNHLLIVHLCPTLVVESTVII